MFSPEQLRPNVRLVSTHNLWQQYSLTDLSITNLSNLVFNVNVACQHQAAEYSNLIVGQKV